MMQIICSCKEPKPVEKIDTVAMTSTEFEGEKPFHHKTIVCKTCGHLYVEKSKLKFRLEWTKALPEAEGMYVGISPTLWIPGIYKAVMVKKNISMRSFTGSELYGIDYLGFSWFGPIPKPDRG